MRWAITGSAGFIGSHVAATAIKNGHAVVGIDNFSTGKMSNVERLQALGGEFSFIEEDINNAAIIAAAIAKCDVVVHLAAQGSVQKSFADVSSNNRQNIDGFVTVLEAARWSGAKKFIYASSCSIYGDNHQLPISESAEARPLSPYATSKLVNDLLADNLRESYRPMDLVGLRFFNIFGSFQDPTGDYSAVIPRWISSLMRGERPVIFGDGEQTRDFCHVNNVCDVALKLSTSGPPAFGTYNICTGSATSLNNLMSIIIRSLVARGFDVGDVKPIYKAARSGDILHSWGSANRAMKDLGYTVVTNLEAGIGELLESEYKA